jgi:5-oxoprolinase (ATP-hydrolysing) subunit A
MWIDLNCDMGESYGRYVLGQDEAVFPFITSANIACGFHAGDPSVMKWTVALAVKHGVGIGAHPGYPDLQGFGRRNMEVSAEEVEDMVLYQVGALAAFARAAGTELTHVKPHGALYNQAAADRALAHAVARGVARFSKQLILVGLAGSALVAAGVVEGLKVANEAFPDRAYHPDGTLVSRVEPGAVVQFPDAVAANALRLAREGISSGSMQVKIDTLCIHGDNPNAALIARAVVETLTANNIDMMQLAKVV